MIRKYAKGNAELQCDEAGPVTLVVDGVGLMDRYEQYDIGLDYEPSVAHLRHSVKGRVLMAGLGIGQHMRMVQGMCQSITVVEINQNVIDLVREYVDQRQVNIVNDDFDSFIQTTDEKFSIVWIDHLDGLTADQRASYVQRCQRLLFDDESEILFWETGE